MTETVLQALEAAFPARLLQQAPLGRYTAARVGGPADVLLEVRSKSELVKAARMLWEYNQSFVVLGGGSNMLVSDRGVRGVVLLNHARRVRFDLQSNPPSVWAESGANFGSLARQAAVHGLSGLEWAAGIPGTLGGAVVGNAGAHGSDTAFSLLLAEILHQDGHEETWPVERLEYSYRSSLIKRSAGQLPQWVVLAARLRLEHSTSEAVQDRMEAYVAFRRRTQPPGASMGSMFKNPPGDYAGRLIEAAGLKGSQVGGAQISLLHANFFVNQGQASSEDVYQLIQLARHTVAEKLGVQLELEIELIGDWEPQEKA